MICFSRHSTIVYQEGFSVSNLLSHVIPWRSGPSPFPRSSLLHLPHVIPLFIAVAHSAHLSHAQLRFRLLLSSVHQQSSCDIMEAEVQQSSSPTQLPAYEEWPTVPTTPLNARLRDEQHSPMEVDELNRNNNRNVRQTSELSQDDIECAQALEGLKAGTKARCPSRPAFN